MTRSQLPQLNHASTTLERNTAGLPDRLTLIIESVVADLEAGRHVFVSGPAGTGKSVLVRNVTRILAERTRRSVALTAPTGIAAKNIGGRTCHSYFGITQGVSNYIGHRPRMPRDMEGVAPSKLPACVVVDEVSMARRDLFDAIASTLRLVNDKRWAGPGLRVPMLAVGDFFQLPPVTPASQRPELEEAYPGTQDFLACDAQSWERMDFRCYELTDPLRQSGDRGYFDALNVVRRGGADGIEALRWVVAHARNRALSGASRIYGINREVDAYNERMLREDPLASGDAIEFYSHTHRVRYSADGEDLSRNWDSGIPRVTTVRTGSLVLVTANDLAGEYVNGDIGRVVDVLSQDMVRVKLVGTEGAMDDAADVAVVTTASRTRLSAFDRAEVVEELMDAGVESVADLKSPWDKHALELALGKRNLRYNQKAYEYALTSDTDGVELAVASCEFMPLKLAYAFTVHKSQGQTLAAVDVDPGRFWDKGQLYVAISRCRDLKGLRFIGPVYESSYVVSQEARAFYERCAWVRDSEFRKVK